jgi:hypothetical protein
VNAVKKISMLITAQIAAAIFLCNFHLFPKESGLCEILSNNRMERISGIENRGGLKNKTGCNVKWEHTHETINQVFLVISHMSMHRSKHCGFTTVAVSKILSLQFKNDKDMHMASWTRHMMLIAAVSFSSRILE